MRAIFLPKISASVTGVRPVPSPSFKIQGMKDDHSGRMSWCPSDSAYAQGVINVLYLRGVLEEVQETITAVSRPAVEQETPLKLPLNFRPHQAVKQPPGGAPLAEGHYTAIRLVKYVEKTGCEGCGKPRQAQWFAVIRNDDVGNEVHIALDCMQKYYGESADRLRAHANAVGKARRDLLARLKLRNVSAEAAVEQVQAMVLAYVPGGEFHLASLKAVDTLMPSKADHDLLSNLQQLALYHREWQDAPDWARHRWNALNTHPMLRFLGSREREMVQLACRSALASQRQLPEQEVHALNRWLQKAATWQPPFRQLVRPEAHLHAEAYEEAVRAALKDLTRTAGPSQVYWRHPFTGHPTESVSSRLKEGYSVAAVKPQEVRRFQRLIQNEDSYRRGSRCAFMEEGTQQVHIEAAQYRRRGGVDTNDDDQDDDLLRPEQRYSYVPVTWALVEHHTATHRAWKLWGRARLESYL
jgi:hypothetical protein